MNIDRPTYSVADLSRTQITEDRTHEIIFVSLLILTSFVLGLGTSFYFGDSFYAQGYQNGWNSGFEYKVEFPSSCRFREVEHFPTKEGKVL